ncbi:MAG: methylated-DNA--[protein]-cysteine S-methyltransferase [Bacteroidaceae bacterium]|nr:methylated-DNA--[protein]-cysteine S-methyltransferase [Bacteroidaceae bacterium]
MDRTVFCKTLLGTIKVVFNNENVVGISFEENVAVDDDFKRCDVVRQLNEYLDASRLSFDFPWSMNGTPFQCRVWQELCKIPYGETRTYGDIAKAIGKPGASRAVGGACHRNPLLFVIPCHRVVGENGKITGFAAGVERKRFLLDMERSGK